MHKHKLKEALLSAAGAAFFVAVALLISHVGANSSSATVAGVFSGATSQLAAGAAGNPGVPAGNYPSPIGCYDTVNSYHGGRFVPGAGPTCNSYGASGPMAPFYLFSGALSASTASGMSDTEQQSAALVGTAWSFTPVTGNSQVGVTPGSPVTLNWACQPSQQITMTYCTTDIFGCQGRSDLSYQIPYSASAAISGSPEFSGSQGVTGSLVVHPQTTTTYNLSCSAFPTQVGYWSAKQNGSGRFYSTITGITNTLPPPVTITILVANSFPKPTAQLTADKTTIGVGETSTITASFGASSPDKLTATAINGTDQVTSVPCANITPSNPQCWTQPDQSKIYAFTPNAPGTYTFYGAVKSQLYSTYNNYGSVTITVVAPSLSITAAPSTVQSGKASTISWSAQAVSNCTVNGPGISANTTNGSQSTGPLSSQSTYTLSCMSGNSPVTKSVTVNIAPAACASAPTQNGCYFYADPTSVLRGGASTLTWSCPGGFAGGQAGGGSSSGTNFSTGGALNGSVQVTPNNTTNYTLTCNPSGSQGNAVVTVVNPTLSITANPLRLRSGTMSTIVWSASGVTPNSCHVDSAAGRFATADSGSKQSAALTQKTTFTLTCSVPSGSLSSSVTVDILPSYNEQ